MDAMTVIRQARDAGLRLEPTGDGLGVKPRERLTPELRILLREHKPAILAALAAAPTIDTLLARHGDASAGGVQWSGWAITSASESDSWLVLSASGLTLLRTAAPVPMPRSYRAAWPLERIGPSDDLEEEFAERAAIMEHDAGLPRAEAERLAADAIQRARSCWGCVALHAMSTASSRLPRCGRGHGIAWRQSATRAWPGRADAAGCSDRTHDPRRDGAEDDL
jgi:hypothetical protein